MRDKDARSWCRIGEALALDWSNVRLHEQSARIGMSKNGETPGHSIAISESGRTETPPKLTLLRQHRSLLRGSNRYQRT
jgi:hypothetical protein